MKGYTRRSTLLLTALGALLLCWVFWSRSEGQATVVLSDPPVGATVAAVTSAQINYELNLATLIVAYGVLDDGGNFLPNHAVPRTTIYVHTNTGNITVANSTQSGHLTPFELEMLQAGSSQMRTQFDALLLEKRILSGTERPY